MRGRKPKAAPATASAGAGAVTVGPWAGSDAAADCPVKMPDWCPGHAGDCWGERAAAIAAERWKVIVAVMTAAGTLDAANASTIRIAASAFAEMVLAEAHVAEFGPIVPAPKSEVPMPNPYRGIADLAAKRLMMAERELGLSPVERGRVTQAKRPQKRKTAADEFLVKK